MDKIRKIIEKHEDIFVMIIATLILLLLHVYCNVTEFVGDGGDYWASAYTFGLDDFNIANYNTSLRGYLLPLCYYFLIKLAYWGIGTEVINLWIFHSVIYAFFIAILFPKLIRKIGGGGICLSLFGKIFFLIVFCIFFKGLIVYPLSDIIGFCFLIGALYCLISLRDEKNRIIKILYSILSGAFMLAAYYVRPVYLIAVIGCLIYMLYELILKKEFLVLVSVVGAIMIMSPQILINSSNFDTHSPLIQTQNNYEGQSLYLMQLKWGMELTKYETNFDLDYYESHQLRFVEPIGQKILQEEDFDTYVGYIKCVITHFGDMACIYLKHIFNGMDIIYPNTYIYKLQINRFWIQLLNYTLLFIGMIGFSNIIKAHKWKLQDIMLLAIYMLPILLVIPTAVETRFFMGANLILYLSASIVLFDKNNLYDLIRKRSNWIRYLSFVVICFIINSEIMGRYAIPLW